MARIKRSTQIEPEFYEHPESESLLRPDVGTQAQFRKKKSPHKYKYDSSLSPELQWDEQNPAREEGEHKIATAIEQLAAVRKKIYEADVEKLVAENPDLSRAALRSLVGENLDQAQEVLRELKAMSAPFLNWAGKAERLSFEVPTLPLFVHERLSTKAILETLKGHTRDRQQDMFQLFGDPQHSVTDQILGAYEHSDKWVNRMILGDSLVVMNSLLRYEFLGEQVQMIYIDPPYGVKFGSNFQPFVRNRDVSHNDDEDLTREPEMVQAYRDTWELGLHSYLTYLRDRLLVARELLHPSGSIFVQISDENLHHVTELLDEVLGHENRVAVIAFKKTGFASDDALSTTHDFILWYARDRTRTKLHSVFGDRELTPDELSFYDQVELPDGTRRPLRKEEKLLGTEVRGIGRPFARNPMISPGWQDSLGYEFEFQDQRFRPPPTRHWATSQDGLERLRQANRLAIKGNTLRFVRYFDDFAFQPLGTIWNDTGVGGFVGDERLYVVQTDTRVIQRCLLMTTDPGDLVLDPTCGSGTTAYVSELWGRRWLTIDTSRVPLALARQRLLTATFPYYELKDESRGPVGGFVYKRKQNKKGQEIGGIVPHITLKSIANNEPQAEEVLVDRPEIKSGVTRVTGPFWFEATIPTPVDWEGDGVEDSAAENYGSFIERMLEVLRRSPVLRLEGNRTVAFKSVRPPAKTLSLSAEALVENGNDKPVSFVFGPENGAVSEKLVFEAAREAYAKSYTHLYVIGFAIQPNARTLVENCAEVVGIPATYVQATPDLMMGDLLKHMRSSQIFSVCGLPEIKVHRKEKKDGPPKYQVELVGLDVFDPMTMEVDHEPGDHVPAWFLDTNYNELSFHVSQAFFPRTSAWDNLKRALRGVYEDSVWQHLASNKSEPFEAGEYKQIAIKVIDDRGNELLVVENLR
jgi:adenine-specific DNA-methyltransferase